MGLFRGLCQYGGRIVAMWIDITTIDVYGQYEVQLNTVTNKIRHRKVLYKDKYIDKWLPGEPPAMKKLYGEEK